MTAEAAAQVDPTEGGRWIVLDGRRWRATDPSIPQSLRQELVNNLMAARRGVGSARRAGDDAAERLARAQVDDAKVALGERGEPWWEPPSEGGRRQRARATVRALSGGRAPDRTICPSDVARAIGGPSWRSLLGMVRDEVRNLARDNVVEVSQRGEPLDPDRDWKGPIRIRRTG
ncbi:MAG: DUF3253 domain-containing protein [Candidatus Nanopelagicales bacterium]